MICLIETSIKKCCGCLSRIRSTNTRWTSLCWYGWLSASSIFGVTLWPRRTAMRFALLCHHEHRLVQISLIVEWFPESLNLQIRATCMRLGSGWLQVLNQITMVLAASKCRCNLLVSWFFLMARYEFSAVLLVVLLIERVADVDCLAEPIEV